MAKKKEQIVDLKPEKVTKEQLTEIQKIVFKIEQLHMTIGQLESKKHANLHILAGVNDEMNIIQEKLRSEYGTNDINISDGKINYSENGEVNKKD